MVKLGKSYDHSRGTVWSNEQVDQMNELWEVVNDLMNTVIQVLHNNRDGRGTPPGKAKVNSMLDRTR